METKIKWKEGEGYITATYEGSGNGSVAVSSDINEGIDRAQGLIISTTEGENPKQEIVNVAQIGLRERYITADEKVLCDANGERYLVLKNR